MARNEEKAMGLLNRWTSYKAELRMGNGKIGRPKFAKDCDSVDQAMQIRRELVREISEKIEKIQNPGLGDARLRDLNDEINVAFRRKYHWERRIMELGGPTFPNEHGGKYQYFGAARNLPEVQEILKPDTKDDQETERAKRTREDLLKNLTYRYYESITCENEDRNGLLAAESELENTIKKSRTNADEPDSLYRDIEVHDDDDPIVLEFEKQLMETVTFSTLPSLSENQKEMLDTSKMMEKIIVEQKKKELAAKYLN